MNERLRALREDKDWTQQQLADMLFINRRTYSAYENGINAVSADTLARIAELFGTSVDYIMGLTDERKLYPPKKDKAVMYKEPAKPSRKKQKVNI